MEDRDRTKVGEVLGGVVGLSEQVSLEVLLEVPEGGGCHGD